MMLRGSGVRSRMTQTTYRLLDAITSFETALTWPEAQQRIQNVLQRGLQRDRDFETHWPEVLGTLLKT